MQVVYGRHTAPPRPELRLRRNTQQLSRELRLFYRELDPMELAPRIASATFLIVGLLILGVDRFVPSVHGSGITLIAVAAALFGLVGMFFPWPRFTSRAQLVLPIFAFVLFAWGGVIAHEHLDAVSRAPAAPVRVRRVHAAARDVDRARARWPHSGSSSRRASRSIPRWSRRCWSRCRCRSSSARRLPKRRRAERGPSSASIGCCKRCVCSHAWRTNAPAPRSSLRSPPSCSARTRLRYCSPTDPAGVGTATARSSDTRRSVTPRRS